MPLEAFLLGLSSGTYCAAACAPVALPFLFSRPLSVSPYRTNAGLLALFLMGRCIAYIAVGALLGAVGAYAMKFVDPGLSRTLTRAAYAVAGSLMIAAGLVEGLSSARICLAARRVWRPGIGAFLFGALTGASICPPFFAAATRVFAGPGVFPGAGYFLFFFFGTSVWLLPLFGVPAVAGRSAVLRFISRSVMTMLGAYFLLVIGLFGTV